MSDQSQPKYQNKIEFLKAVIEKFKAVEKLSVGDGYCLYGTEINGMGCAVGCMLDPADANLLDEKYRNENIFSVSRAYAEIYTKYFPLDWTEGISSPWGMKPVQAGFLDELQSMHDNAADVAEFLKKTEDWLDVLEMEQKNEPEKSTPSN